MKRHSLLIALFLGSISAAIAVDFAKDLWPAIEEKCVGCHREEYEENGRAKKPKAGLRLDGAWAFHAGSENGKVMVPGKSAESYLYEVITLPEDDDMFMPPKGDVFTEAESEILKKWIDEGADFGEWTGNQNGRPEDFVFGEGEGGETGQEKVVAPVSPYDALSEGVTAASEEGIKAVEAAGGRVTPLAPDHPLVRVDYVSTAQESGDDAVAALSDIAGNVAQLDLGRTKVTSAALEDIGKLERLRTLDLHSTEVGDDGMQHLSALKNLAYLNLYDTKVTDQGIAKLAGLKNLESLYLWKSAVSEDGVKQLAEKLPNTKINFR